MSSVELVYSQLPLAQDYIGAIRTQWQLSRHRENLRDVSDSVKNEDASLVQKIGAAVCLIPIAWALGPGNEMTLGAGVGAVMKHTESIPAAIATTPAITTPLELGAGLGISYLVSKFKGATDILKERYVKVNKEEDSEAERSGKKGIRGFLRTLGIVSLTGTGASGATLDTALHEDDHNERKKRTKRTALVASAILGAINAGYAAVILGVGKGAESAGAHSATDSIANFISNPVYVGSLLFSAVSVKQQIDYFRTKVETTDHESISMIGDSTLANDNQINDVLVGNGGEE